MRIGLSFAALVNKGGIGRYVRILARELPNFFPEHSYAGYVPEFRKDETDKVLEREKIEGWELITVPSGNRWAFETSGLPKILIENPPDIFHGPDYLAPKAPCPVCVTVHDLAFRLQPAGMALKSRLLFRFLTPGSVNRASKNGRVFCDSQSTLDDLIKLRWINEDKGSVVHLACEDEFREPVPQETILDVLDKCMIPENYSLYVGPIEKRKNLGVLVDAYNLVGIVLKHREERTPPLIAVGPLGAGGRRLVKSLKESSQGHFHHLGYVSRDDLHALYAGCSVFCYPSRYEGFGLPPLEAMSHGKAVVVSDASSLPEVVGDAGLKIDPNDIQAWSHAILRILTNDQYRTDLEQKSLEQSRKFSVEKMCREVMEGYIAACGQTGDRHPNLPGTSQD